MIEVGGSLAQSGVTGTPVSTKHWILREAQIAAATSDEFENITDDIDGEYRAVATLFENADIGSPITDNGIGLAQFGDGTDTDTRHPAAVPMVLFPGSFVFASCIFAFSSDSDISWEAPSQTLFSATTGTGLSYSIGGRFEPEQVAVSAVQTAEGLTDRQAHSALVVRPFSTRIEETTLGVDGTTRRLFVSILGDDGNDGLSSGAAKRTIDAALDIAVAGDTITIQPGLYRERPSGANRAGTVTDPIWIVAERRGETRVAFYREDAYNGTASWTDEGDGVWSIATDEPYSGSHNGDFMFRYDTEADLKAASIDVPSVLGGDNTITKPAYGIAFEGGRTYIKLRGRVNPNGRQIKLTNAFATNIFNFDNCDHIIVDGLRVEASGSAAAIDFDTSSEAPTVRNCVSDHSRFLARVSSDFLVEWNEYTFTGYAQWMRDLIVLDGLNDAGIFDIHKNYYSSAGDTFLEGGIIVGASSFDNTGGTVRHNYIHGVFEGMRAGEFDDCDIHDNVIKDVGDNWVEFESFRSSDKSENIRFYHNLCQQSHDIGLSHQPGNDYLGPHYVYGNVFENDDPTLASPRAMIKTIDAATNANTAEINYWNNSFTAIRGGTKLSSPNGQVSLWGQSFGSDDAERITRVQNNVAIFPDGMDNTAQANPGQNRANVLAAPSDNAPFQANGGSRVADESALLLGTNRELLSGSPLIGAGQAVPVNFPTVDGTSDSDVGPFEEGFDPGANWPRAQATTFNTAPPAAILVTLAALVASISTASADLELTGPMRALSSAVSGAIGSTQAVVSLEGFSGSASTVSGFFPNVVNIAGGADSVSGHSAPLLKRVLASTQISSVSSVTSAGLTFSGATTLIQSRSSVIANASPPRSAIPALGLAQSFLDSVVQEPVFLVDLFFDSGTLHIWTRAFQGTFGGKEYVPLAGIASGFTFTNSLVTTAVDSSIQLSGQNQALINIALAEDYRNRRSNVYLANASGRDIVAAELLFPAFITNMVLSEDRDQSRVSITLESVFKTASRPQTFRQTPSDLSRTSSDDTFYDFLEAARTTTPQFGN